MKHKNVELTKQQATTKKQRRFSYSNLVVQKFRIATSKLRSEIENTKSQKFSNG
jgi:hypothetical protein